MYPADYAMFDDKSLYEIFMAGKPKTGTEDQVLNIKITGGGSRKEISDALTLIAKSILESDLEDIDGAEWEDCTLMTEINAETLVECDGCGTEIPETDLYCNNCGNENF